MRLLESAETRDMRLKTGIVPRKPEHLVTLCWPHLDWKLGECTHTINDWHLYPAAERKEWFWGESQTTVLAGCLIQRARNFVAENSTLIAGLKMFGMWSIFPIFHTDPQIEQTVIKRLWPEKDALSLGFELANLSTSHFFWPHPCSTRTHLQMND